VGGSYAATRPGPGVASHRGCDRDPGGYSGAPAGTMTSWAWIVTASGLPSSYQLKQLSPAPRRKNATCHPS